jgi:hypothetical protein
MSSPGQFRWSPDSRFAQQDRTHRRPNPVAKSDTFLEVDCIEIDNRADLLAGQLNRWTATANPVVQFLHRLAVTLDDAVLPAKCARDGR